MLKRLFDFTAALAGIVAASPLLLSLAALVKCADGGPVFYRGVRAGLGGRHFRMFKFRTMVPNAEQLGGPSTAGDDPRITRVGSFLRKYKLDELPQLFDILLGNMSFVGPRPQVLEDVERYSDEERLLLAVRPGITDYASIRFRHEDEILQGHSDPDAAYDMLIRSEKIRLGLEYVRTHTLQMDMAILIRTLLSVLDRRPARRHSSEVTPR
jgi:lipopolysaccharide/colanic/teichoic acid biosynthesis glycosyltransferase